MKYLVTGGAGFIGSNLVDALMEEGHEVIAFDNLSSGEESYVAHHMGNDRFKLIKGDLMDPPSIEEATKGIEFVFHLAANPDVRHGIERTRIDLEQGTIATHNLLEAMRKNGVKKIGFSSSSTVYGEATELPTPETYGPMLPISLYGASKLACEGMISSYCHSFNMQAWMYRFANVIGHRGTHGVLVDFIEKLRNDPTNMEILGDGKQKKSYFLVQDCVAGLIMGTKKSNEQVNMFNLACEEWTDVTEVADIVTQEMNLENVEYHYTGGTRGWVGDIPRTWLSIDKARAMGWGPSHSSEEAVRLAVRDLLKSR
ncbi:MAG: NAD-dependent epimerase/dehydratase family protein [Thermoplasmata archaeon]|nr:NAD-dependent epimerase/dehydratase family protein [Thermoplasmata archaeon]MCK5397729.1 NAD-dependent epimerase/dehydratase family protein [Thermoplasmata archaeon]